MWNDLIGTGKDLVVGSCEHFNEPVGSIKWGHFLLH
jgi:hypothetical protein